MKKLLLTGLCGLGAFLAGYTQPIAEKNAIKNLCGCYEVDFKYAETFAADSTYKLAKPYHNSGVEYVVAQEESNKKIVIQHLLISNDETVIKHWREDWEYEKTDWLLFNYDATWARKNATQPVKGQWTQTVWEVDDAPRYQGTSKWVNNNNKYYWENTTDAPLPRREYTHRSDYNVLQRSNRIQFTPQGWLHEQDNKKIIRADGQPDKWLVEEKGYNNYVKISDSKCAAAKTFWREHQQFWNTVRLTWEETLAGKKMIHLQSKIDGLRLHQKLDQLEKDHLTETQLKNKLKEILSAYTAHSDNKSVASTSSKSN